MWVLLSLRHFIINCRVKFELELLAHPALLELILVIRDSLELLYLNPDFPKNKLQNGLKLLLTLTSSLLQLFDTSAELLGEALISLANLIEHACMKHLLICGFCKVLNQINGL